MATLVPTVHERLARCNTAVYVDGLVTGATVELSVDGTPFSVTAMGGGHVFAVPSLTAGAKVKARQDDGSGFTPWSPEVVVEDALVPPEAGPLLPDEVGWCSHCVLVQNMVPGCDVELKVGADVVGKGKANRHGKVCVGVNIAKLPIESGMFLTARMSVCGVQGPPSSAPLVPESVLPKPVIGSPVFGCQTVIPVSNLRRGALAHFESDAGDSLGGICSCWTAVNVSVIRPLVPGESVRTQQSWTGAKCKGNGPWSDWRLVEKPDERIKPKIQEVLVAGDQVIRVENQIPGATLVIRIRPAEGQPAEEFGPRPVSPEPEIALNAPLAAGNVLTVVQTLCGHSEESDPVEVQPAPPKVLPPVVIPPLYECGTAVQVSGLHPGAMVRVYLDGIPIGTRWAGEESSVSVTASPALVSKHQVTATQTVGSVTSLPSAPVPVETIKTVQPPRILGPVATGDTQVVVSRVAPGARVTIRSGGEILGEASAAEPVVRVGVSPVAGAVQASARLCAKSATGAALDPITLPCAPGPRPKSGERSVSYDVFTVPDHSDGGSFDIQIEGQLYYPGDGDKLEPNLGPLPLVVIAHGYWAPGIESFKGYDYLAHHLARWGMLVFSVNMDKVNNQTSVKDPHQYARGEIILHAIDQALADPSLKGRVDSNNIGLIGHSMGGEGVVMAQHLNFSDGRGYALRGVVSIAPTHYRKEIALRGTKYMQLLGSLDLLMSNDGDVTGPDAHFSGFRIYDKAERPKTHFWIYKARHNPFNRVWVANGDTFESGWADQALPPEAHERIARCLINAFFQDALFGSTAYAGYMEGTILPRSLSGLEIHVQHSREPRVVVDNFGDPDTQEGLADLPLDRAVNSLNQSVNAAGGGLGTWDDVAHVSLASSPHQTKSTELSWSQPDVIYTQGVDGRSLALTDVAALRVSQFYEDATLNPVGEPVELFVILADSVQEARVRLGVISQVPYPDSSGNVLSVLRTMRLPADAFKAVQPALNLNDIRAVKLELIGRATGHVLVDDIELGG
ncbi:MAG TPA: hypothetical protein VMW27_21850 [Thermoanaerobaculia bacterium]|nr:hypothetical protein [Thermoanaerobaculia bacterium]